MLFCPKLLLGFPGNLPVVALPIRDLLETCSVRVNQEYLEGSTTAISN